VPDAGPEPEPDAEPEPEPDAEPEPEPDPTTEVEIDADSTPEAEPLRRRHVRRRKAGRYRKAAKAGAAEPDEAAELEAALPAPEVDDAPVTEMSAPAETVHVRGAGLRRFGSAFVGVVRRVLAVLLIIVLLMGASYGLVIGVNAFARWNALRLAAVGLSASSPIEDNLLVIGVGDGVAVGFTALKVERSSNRVLGIAIPEGAFMEVPGQGFERIGSSYTGGPEVSKDAVTNYLGVPFRSYVVVDAVTYQALLTHQDVAGMMASVTATDLSFERRAALTKYMASVKTKDVWIAPLPVKPVAVGDQRYFEPQRDQVADLLLQWWGVQASARKATPRVIVYNGVGTPGLAGVASQQLIRAGLRVVDSGNADKFDYLATVIYLYHGTQADAEAVRSTLGVGRILVQSAPQDLADMIIIIGADYRPPTSDLSTVPTEGVK
jgi:hypothetical protein